MIRGKFKYDKDLRKVVPMVEEEKQVVDAPYVIEDEREAFENPVTGEMETSMRGYRQKLKNLGYFEKGNDRMHYELPSREERMAEIREDVEEAKRQIKYGVAESSELEREIWRLQNEGRDAEAKELWEKNRQK